MLSFVRLLCLFAIFVSGAALQIQPSAGAPQGRGLASAQQQQQANAAEPSGAARQLTPELLEASKAAEAKESSSMLFDVRSFSQP